jgi:hypothetical protein
MQKINNEVSKFRAIDFKNQFKQPFNTFIEALEALQGPIAYMGHTGKIVCYLTDGTEVSIPDNFFTYTQLKFSNEAQAKAWLKACKEQEKLPIYAFDSRECKLQIISAKMPFDEQVHQAMRLYDKALISQDENELADKKVSDFLALVVLNKQNTTRRIPADSSQPSSDLKPVAEHINNVLTLVANTWIATPELRLMQLLMNIIEPADVSQLYYLSDNKLKNLLIDWTQEFNLTIDREQPHDDNR